MSSDLQLSLGEASFVTGLPKSAINKAVERKEIRARVRRHGKTVYRVFGWSEVRSLCATRSLSLDSGGRRKFYVRIVELSPDQHRLALGDVEVDIGGTDRQLRERLRRLADLRAAVEDGPDGEPRLRGTGVPVHLIAALAKGQTADEILEDYPGLTPEQVQLSIEYARAHPKSGRPYPTRSLKRMLGDLELHDLDLERTHEGPRKIAV